MNPPKVTVLMSVFNGLPFLGGAIESVLTQTLADFEFIIIDDGSADGSRQLIEGLADPRIRLLVNDRNLGLTRSLNRGLGEAKGEYVARQDADDLSLSQRLVVQADYLDRNPKVAVVGVSAEFIDQQGRAVLRDSRSVSHAAMRWRFLFGNPMPHPGVMFRRKEVIEAGGYREEFRFAQDYDLWSRLSRRAEAVRLSDILIQYRQHSRATSSAKRSEQNSFRDSIARENMERLLGERVEPDQVAAFHVKLRKRGRCLAAARLAERLWRAADQAWPSSPAEHRLIRREAARTLFDLARLYARPLPMEAARAGLAALRIGLGVSRPTAGPGRTGRPQTRDQEQSTL